MRKRFVATLTIMLITALALVGCSNGGGASSDPNLGRYEGYAISIFNTNEPIEDTYDEGENYVELQEEGKAIVCLDGNPLSSTYTLDQENITLVINEDDGDYNSEGTLKDGVLTFDFLGLGLDLTFVKEGVEKPFEVTSSKPTDVTDSADAEEDASASDDESSSAEDAASDTSDAEGEGEASETTNE